MDVQSVRFQQVPCGLEQKVSGGGGRAGHGRSDSSGADLAPDSPMRGQICAGEAAVGLVLSVLSEANRITFVMWEASTFLTIIPGIKELDDFSLNVHFSFITWRKFEVTEF